MGADACSIGRGYLYPLAAGGEAGVTRALHRLRDEIERDMILMGCDRLDKLDRSKLRPAGVRFKSGAGCDTMEGPSVAPSTIALVTESR